MKASKYAVGIMLAAFLFPGASLWAQAPQLPITVTKEKKTIVISTDDAATKQEALVAEYLKLVANEFQELIKTQALDCSWAVTIKLIPKGSIKLLEITLEDKDNRSAPNKITKTALPFEKEQYPEQSKATAKRLLQLMTCSSQP